MLPDELFWGIDLYTIMICLGIVFAIGFFRIFCDRKKLPAAAFNFFLVVALVGVALGMVFATLVQSFYNFLESGVWEWRGMTFLGGLVGGVAVGVALYFLLGHFIFREKKTHIKYFGQLLQCAIPCIVLAHAFGRIGCLFAGCCYGIHSDAFGLPMFIDGALESRVPTQALEAVFLFALFAVLSVLLFKTDTKFIPEIYMIAYGVWRFAIEYLRDDPRGNSGISFLTPSQFTSILLVLGGIALILFFLYGYPKLKARRSHETAE